MSKIYRRIVTMGMISFTSALAWIYCMLSYREEPLYIVGISVILLCSIYALFIAIANMAAAREEASKAYILDALSRLVPANTTDASEETERIMKALYVQVRKLNNSFSSLDSSQAALLQQTAINDELKDTLADSINKAVKISIKYSQADTDKIISALDAVVKQLSEMPIYTEANSKADKNAFPDSYTATDSETIANYASAPEFIDDDDSAADTDEFSSLFAFDASHSSEQPDTYANNLETYTPASDDFDGIAADNFVDSLMSDNFTDSPADDFVDTFDSDLNSDSASASAPAADIDPTKPLSPDEIAALFAAMGN